MALEFIGGALFTLLYDGVKKAMGRTTKFKSVLEDLNFTLDCLQPLIIQQIGEHNLEMGLPNEEIQNLQRQMEAGVKLVCKLSKVGLCEYCCCVCCNCWIWCNCCNCVEPSYTYQLAELDRSLRRLLERMRLQEARDVKELLLLGRKSAEKLDQLERRQSELLKMQQEAVDILRAQQEARDVREFSASNTESTVHQRIEGNGVQQVSSLDGGETTALGAVFEVLFDAVMQVKDNTTMYKRVLRDIKSTLDVLKPLIEEITEDNKVFHLPKEELENFRIQMEKGVEVIHKCSKVHQWARYKKYGYTSKLFELDESLHRLLSILRVQIASHVKKTLASISKIETEMKQIESKSCSPMQEKRDVTETLDLAGSIEAGVEEIEGSEVVQNQIEHAVAKPPLPTFGLGVLNVQGTRDVNIKAGVERIEGSGRVQNQNEVVVAEPPSPTFGLDVLAVQRTSDVNEKLDLTWNIKAGVERIEGSGEVVEAEAPSLALGLDVLNVQERKNVNQTLDSARNIEEWLSSSYTQAGILDITQTQPVADNQKCSASIDVRDSGGEIQSDYDINIASSSQRPQKGFVDWVENVILTPPLTTANPESDEKNLEDELSRTIHLADRVIKSAQEAESSKQDCADLVKQVERLSQMLRSVIRIAATTQSIYERPVRRIVAGVVQNLDRALTLVCKCKGSGVLRQVFSIITTTADFRKVSNLLEYSVGDMKWLLSIFESDGADLSLPPIAVNDPILSWVWSYISTIYMGQPRDRVEATDSLASLARDNDRNKKIIVEEGGVTPLLKLLKEGSSPDAQVAAANALFEIAMDQERVRAIIDLNGIGVIVSVLKDSRMRVQVSVVKLVSEMAELDPVAQNEFARENVTRPLVTLLAMDTVLDDPKLQPGKPSIHSLVQINKELVGKGSNPNSRRGAHYRKERDREAESPEVKLKLKVGCAEALCKLCKGCLLNSRKVTETKGLICLAKIIEKELGELQLNCLMTVMEIAAMAESNVDLRRAAFKPNSPAAKAVLDQLLRVIREETSPELKIPAIKAIGSLARTFPMRETRIVGPLVSQLGSENVDVATEAAIALGKFVTLDNFNCVEHSKTIVEFDAVPSLMRLLRTTDRINERAHKHCLVLLCYLALNVGNSEALQKERALNTLEGKAQFVASQYPDLRDLFAKAIHNLNLYQAG